LIVSRKNSAIKDRVLSAKGSGECGGGICVGMEHFRKKFCVSPAALLDRAENTHF
jgi:hypothetical protein